MHTSRSPDWYILSINRCTYKHYKHSFRYFRGVEVDVPGLANDRCMLANSHWNNPAVSTDDAEDVGPDLGYNSTVHVNASSPFDELEATTSSTLAAWDKHFNSD